MANTTRLIVDTAYTTLSFTAADLNSLASGGAALSAGTGSGMVRKVAVQTIGAGVTPSWGGGTPSAFVLTLA